MSWSTGHARGSRIRTILLAITALALLAAWGPTAAHAAGCTDTFTNTKGGSWFTASNWSTKAVPGASDEACITENGTYTVEMTGTSTVTLKALTIGGSSGSQTLIVASTCSLNAVLSTTSGLSNGAQGAVTMTNGDACANNVTLSGPITNAGTITTEAAHGGARTLAGALTNTGKLVINANTAYNSSGALLSNQGAINVAEAVQLSATGSASVTNGAGGKIVASGSGDVLQKEGTFTEGAGTISGATAVIVDDAALAYTGSGAGSIAARGTVALSGSTAAGQTLSIESTVSENAQTTAATSFTNAGAIVLTNGDSAGNNATLTISAGTLTNSGSLTTETLHGGTRTIFGNVTNTGTLAINANTTFSQSSSLLKNEGALNLAEGKQLTVISTASATNGTGGKIVGTGSGVLFEQGGTFSEGAGTITGTKAVIVDDAALAYTGAGAGLIALRGNSTLSGATAAGQTLSIESTSGENATTTAAAGFSNAGTILLTNGDASGNTATLTVTGGALANSGTLSSEAAIGGARTLQASVNNTGTININANTAYSQGSSVLKNEGALNLAEGRQLTVNSTASVTNGTGGKIVATGSGVLFEQGGTFTEGAGTITGTKPVIVDDAALLYTGSGAGLIALRGNSTLSGNLAAGQTLSIESTTGEHATVTAAIGFTNAGSILLTNGDTAGNNATLAVSSGTLLNSGTLSAELIHGGARTLQGNLTNTGTININTNTSDSITGATVSNSGTINIATGAGLSFTSKPAISNEAGAIVATGTGVLSQAGGTFNEGLGKATGAPAVIIDDGALQYSNKGASTIALRGNSTLSGAINAGQVLEIQSTCAQHAVTASAAFVNSGTLDLTNGDGCGNNATLSLGGGTLENKGTINAEEPHGGTRTIEGSVKNEKTVSLSAGATLKLTAGFTQGKKGTLKTAVASGSSYGILAASGAASIDGSLQLVQSKTFLGKAGESFAILTSSARTGTFAKVKSVTIKKTVGLYYKPTYSGTGVTLVVTLASFTLSSASGLPGSPLTLSGAGYVPGDTVKLTFTDHKGAKTVLPTATVNGSGEYSLETIVPAEAVEGAGKVNAKSTLTSVSITKTFTVT